MDDYAAAKARLFAWPNLHYAIINADDAYAAHMLSACKNGTHDDSHMQCWRYSLSDTTADFFVRDYQAHAQGVTISLVTPQGTAVLASPLLGVFNIANLVAAVAATMAQGLALDQIVAVIPQLHGADGRMQTQAAYGANFIVDYAHTPDALHNALTSLRVHAPESALTVVFGCGGDRDRGKRPLMTRAALAHADRIIITADNPRSESPTDIIADMLATLSEDEQARVIVEPDRRDAITLSVDSSQAGDVVLIAGKGHETYQEIQGIRHDFDDRVVLADAIDKRLKATAQSNS